MDFKKTNSFKNKLAILGLLISLLSNYDTFAQSEQRKTQINFFGHVEYELDKLPSTTNSFLGLGEQDFFINLKITDKFSSLGKNVIRPDLKSATLFSTSIERMQIKYDYYNNQSLIVGKMHTPLYHWNDVYHHGRLFFPTVDRPLAFSY
jgi:hypothetical protein